MERSDLVELHKELGYGGAERLYQAAARQLREGGVGVMMRAPKSIAFIDCMQFL